MTSPAPSTRIRAIRTQHGLTLQQIADKLNTTPQTIQRLEVGAMTVSMKWLHAIADVLGVPPSELLVEERARAPSPDETFLDMMRAELVRARRTGPLSPNSPLLLIEATGKLAEGLLDWQAGLKHWNDVARFGARAAAAAMLIAVDGDSSGDVAVRRQMPARLSPPKLVASRP